MYKRYTNLIYGGKTLLSRTQTGCYKRRRQEAFGIIDKEPTISIKNLASRMGVNNGYAGNWLIAYRRHIKR